jgi:hypothetical protein
LVPTYCSNRHARLHWMKGKHRFSCGVVDPIQLINARGSVRWGALPVAAVEEGRLWIACGMLTEFVRRTRFPFLSEDLGGSWVAIAPSYLVDYSRVEESEHAEEARDEVPPQNKFIQVMGRVIYSVTWLKHDARSFLTNDLDALHFNRIVGRVVGHVPLLNVVLVLMDDDIQLNLHKTQRHDVDCVDGSVYFLRRHESQPPWLMSPPSDDDKDEDDEDTESDDRKQDEKDEDEGEAELYETGLHIEFKAGSDTGS